jgi:hypothetical protein
MTTPPMTLTDRQRASILLTRVFLYSSRVAHLLRPHHSPNDGYGLAYCGASPQWGMSWYGTGSDAEQHKAATLALCKRCVKYAPPEWVPTSVAE